VQYALKVISKSRLLSHKPETRLEWLRREKGALAELDHPFIIKLRATYNDANCLYFLLELALGGELFRVMGLVEKMPEAGAQFYIGSLVLALQHVHAHEYVYRDVKPENVMLDQFGFVKLCDFGFAKKVVDRTYTQCGTPDYVSPEMLKGQGVNQAADWWSLGVLLFEMLAGFTPFTDPDGDEMKTFAAIIAGQIDFRKAGIQPGELPAWARLVSDLTQVKVASRLGYLKGGADDIVQHAWFARYDWDGLINRTIEAPWRPRLRAADDVCYFDGEDQQTEPPSAAKVAAPEVVQQYEPEFEEFVS